MKGQTARIETKVLPRQLKPALKKISAERMKYTLTVSSDYESRISIHTTFTSPYVQLTIISAEPSAKARVVENSNNTVVLSIVSNVTASVTVCVELRDEGSLMTSQLKLPTVDVHVERVPEYTP